MARKLYSDMLTFNIFNSPSVTLRKISGTTRSLTNHKKLKYFACKLQIVQRRLESTVLDIRVKVLSRCNND